MAAPAEIPHADEALKTLVRRFKAAPGSSAFTELAAALLARGHAAEALRITEHGLQLVPDSVEGRVERSAALLAQGRPRMAYVELRRALAIEPRHRRAQRLLGKAFVDAGAPERAAELLARRSQASAEAPPTQPPASNLAAALIGDLTDDDPPTEAAWPAPGAPPPADSDLPDLFSSLTEDLGLGSAVPEPRKPPRRVEVTQIMRRKARPRPPRTASELAEIDGPIVDNTQPTPAFEVDDEPVQAVTTRDPPPLLSPHPDLASLSLGDEPLFQEHMPFAVRPVSSGASEDLPPVEATARAHPTPPRPAPVGPAPEGPSAGDAAPSVARARPLRPLDPQEESTASGESGAVAVPGRTAAGEVRSPPPAGLDSGRRPHAGPRTGTLPTSETGRIEGPGPIVERERARHPEPRRLAVAAPPTRPFRIALALMIALLMAAYFFGWLLFFQDVLSIWWVQ